MDFPPIVATLSTADDLYIGGIPYRSAASIAREHRYTRDYVARLCRQGKVRGRRLGKLWYVDTESFAIFVRRNS